MIMELKPTIKNLFKRVLDCPKKYPLECINSLIIFLTLLWSSTSNAEASHPTATHYLWSLAWLAIPVTIVAIRLRQCDRKLGYWLTLPVLLLIAWLLCDTKNDFYIPMAYVLGFIVLIYRHGEENESFVRRTFDVVLKLLMTIGCALLLTLAWLAIVQSVNYIFALNLSNMVIMSGSFFACGFLAPLIFVMLYDEDRQLSLPQRLLHVALDFIVSPAVIIYATLLYIYAAQILITWNLPKGGVAAMVTGFLAVSLLACMMQKLLSRQHYKWFYGNLTWISIAPLVLFFTGTAYRISNYGFTASRAYLLAIGIVLTLAMLLLRLRSNRSYSQIVALTAIAVIITTYVPYVSARDIGIRSQKSRLEKLMAELHATDPATGKLHTDIDMDAIKANFKLARGYAEMSDIISYLSSNLGKEQFQADYGKWDHHSYEFHSSSVEPLEKGPKTIYRKGAVEIGEYTQLLNTRGEYKVEVDKDTVILLHGDTTLLRQSLTERLAKGEKPEQLLTVRQGDYMVVLSSVTISADGKKVEGANVLDAVAFKKRQLN